MKNKTLIYGGIGIAVLIIGFMAYKKFGKKNEEAKETDDDNSTQIIKTTKAPIEQENTALVPKEDLALLKMISDRNYFRKKRGKNELFTKKEENYIEQKIMLNDLRFNDLPEKVITLIDTYKKENPAWKLLVDEYIKKREKAIKNPNVTATAVPKKSFAGFMDFDANDDLQGSIM